MTNTDPLDELPEALREAMRAYKAATAVRCPTCGAGIGRRCRNEVRTDICPARRAR